MSRKRKNESELVKATDSEVVDFLDRDPYLFRTIQALFYIEKNSVRIIPNKDPKIVFEGILQIIQFIFNNFFSSNNNRLGSREETNNIEYTPILNNEEEGELTENKFYGDGKNTNITCEINLLNFESSDYEKNFSLLISRLNIFLEKYTKDLLIEINKTLPSSEKITINCYLLIETGILIDFNLKHFSSYTNGSRYGLSQFPPHFSSFFPQSSSQFPTSSSSLQMPSQFPSEFNQFPSSSSDQFPHSSSSSDQFHSSKMPRSPSHQFDQSNFKFSKFN